MTQTIDNSRVKAMKWQFRRLSQARHTENYLRTIGCHELADQLITALVSHGPFKSCDQRPDLFLPELTAQPVWKATDFPIAAMLEDHWEQIRDEFDACIRNHADDTGFVDAEAPKMWDGSWQQLFLYLHGRPRPYLKHFPGVEKLLQPFFSELDVPMSGISFSRLSPGTIIDPHFGTHNARLRVHLPIHESPGAVLKVGDEELEWKNGQCLIFDDSFSHSVRHDGDQDRIVLILDIWHPETDRPLRDDIIEVTGNRRFMMKDAREFMRNRQIKSITNEDEGLSVQMNPDIEMNIQSIMNKLMIEKVECTDAENLDVTPKMWF